MSGKYKALDIARYIITICNEHRFEISNLKLQKLMYFVEGIYLLINGKENSLLDEEFQAWDYGPVIPSVYHEFKGNGASSITDTDIIKIREIEGETKITFEEFNKNVIKINDREFINKIIEQLGKVPPFDLVNVTHAQRAWIDAYDDGNGKGNIISDEAIYDSFVEMFGEH